jgi:hypothetical protein
MVKKKDELTLPVVALILSFAGVAFLFYNKIAANIILFFSILFANASKKGKYKAIAYLALVIGSVSLVIGLFSQLSDLLKTLKFFENKTTEVLNQSIP